MSVGFKTGIATWLDIKMISLFYERCKACVVNLYFRIFMNKPFIISTVTGSLEMDTDKTVRVASERNELIEFEIDGDLNVLDGQVNMCTFDAKMESDEGEDDSKVNRSLETNTATHSQEKSHSCTVCTKTFNHGGKLKVHLRTHSGEKPYPCTFCKKVF